MWPGWISGLSLFVLAENHGPRSSPLAAQTLLREEVAQAEEQSEVKIQDFIFLFDLIFLFNANNCVTDVLRIMTNGTHDKCWWLQPVYISLISICLSEYYIQQYLSIRNGLEAVCRLRSGGFCYDYFWEVVLMQNTVYKLCLSQQ